MTLPGSIWGSRQIVDITLFQCRYSGQILVSPLKIYMGKVVRYSQPGDIISLNIVGCMFQTVGHMFQRPHNLLMLNKLCILTKLQHLWFPDQPVEPWWFLRYSPGLTP